MSQLSLPIDYFKKTAKLLWKHVAGGDRLACQRARAVFNALAKTPDPQISAAFTLMRAQHVVAIEYGFGKWEELACGLCDVRILRG
ncbi:MAG TPA: hypothetical protein VF921_07295 [Vicinamibacterales bacterium]